MSYLNLRVMNWRICQDRYARGGTSSGAIGTVGYGWYAFQGTVGTLFWVRLVHFSGYGRYTFRIWQGTLVPPELYQLYPSCVPKKR